MYVCVCIRRYLSFKFLIWGSFILASQLVDFLNILHLL